MNQNASLFFGSLLFILMHSLSWITTNVQFMGQTWSSRSLYISMALSIPTTLAAYYGSRLVYSGLGGSAWGMRILVFGLSWLVFPIMTWALLGEDPLNPKTLICVALSFVIIAVQLYWP